MGSYESTMSRARTKVSQHIDEFKPTSEKPYRIVKGDVLLKTQTNNFKQRFIMLMSNEIYFQKRADSDNHEFMHQLAGTFIELKDPVEHSYKQEDNSQSDEAVMLYPLKIVLGP